MEIEALLAAIRDRKQASGPFGYGISTADMHLKQVAACMGDSECLSKMFDGVVVTQEMWTSFVKDAEAKFTYCDDDMSVVEHSGLIKATATSTGGFEKILKRIKGEMPSIPKHCAMVFENVITSTREDRDRDVMESSGGVLDMKMLMLWQHVPLSPVGKMLGLVEQTKKWIKVVSCVLELNQTSADAIKLIEAEAMRISHGFKPLKFSPLVSSNKDDNRPTGFHVEKFEIVEESLVSVPANVDAVITTFSRGKLHSPMIKNWAKSMFDDRKAMSPGITIDTEKAADGKYVVRERMGDFERELKFADQGMMKSYLAGEIKDVAGLPGKSCECKNKGAVPKFEKTKSSSKSKWDAAGAIKRLKEWAKKDEEVDLKKFARGFAYVKGDGDAIADYSLPHHDIEDGEITVVPRGVTAAIAAINGGRGDVKWGNEKDRAKAYNHLAKHYAQFSDEDAPPLKSWDDYTKAAKKEEEESEEDEEMMDCPECESEIPVSSTECPECGCKIKKKKQVESIHDFARMIDDGEFDITLSEATVDSDGSKEIVIIAHAVPQGSDRKLFTPTATKAYVQLKGSWEDIASKLRMTIKDHLKSNEIINDQQYSYVMIEAMYDKYAIVDASIGSSRKMYSCQWAMSDGEPKWKGKPKEVEIEANVVDKSSDFKMFQFCGTGIDLKEIKETFQDRPDDQEDKSSDCHKSCRKCMESARKACEGVKKCKDKTKASTMIDTAISEIDKAMGHMDTIESGGKAFEGLKSLETQLSLAILDSDVEDIESLQAIKSIVGVALRDLESAKNRKEADLADRELAELLGLEEKGNPHHGADGKFTTKPQPTSQSMTDSSGSGVTADGLASRIISQMGLEQTTTP